MSYKYFSHSDFHNATPPCKVEDMNPVFLDQLDVARFHAGVPFIVNSAFRTVQHERTKGRDGKSSHIKGLAVDLKATGSRQRFKIIEGLLKAGFTRIGVDTEKGFVHVDADPDKDQNVIWGYGDG